MLLLLLVALAVCFATLPAALFVANLSRFRAPFPERRLRAREAAQLPAVSVLIPARNEQANIAACLESVLASTGIVLEVLVLDDSSTDRTSEIVRSIAARDPRVRLARGEPLPPNWNGKQHACWLLAQQARTGLFLFLDADVRLAPDTIVRCATTLKRSGIELLSGFPRQITRGWLEQLLLPLIHFVLLGFLPLSRMSRSSHPAYAAGCGQFMMVEQTPYFLSGGHLAIRETRHDGMRLPQLLRRHGLRTDIVDLTDFAEVRMYDSTRAVWQGLAKNATEGLAAPARIVPFTLMLLLGQVLPLLLTLGWIFLLPLQALAAALAGSGLWTPGFVLLSCGIGLALVASYLPRFIAARRFHQPLLSALFHPLGIMVLLLLQWYALTRQLMGRPVGWRARNYSTRSGEEIV